MDRQVTTSPWAASILASVLALSLGGIAEAQVANPSGNPGFLNLSFSGDGHTVTGGQLFAAQDRTAQAAQTAVTATPDGEVSYSIPVDLPPALLQPSLSLGYSGSSTHTTVGPGWGVSSGMTISLPSLVASAHAYASRDIVMINGGGLSGRLVDDGAGWTYVSEQPRLVHAEFDDVGQEWTITTQGVTTTLRADDGVSAARIWRAVHEVDARGNTIEYVRTGPYLDQILYGHNADSQKECGAGAPPITVTLQYEPVPAEQRSWDATQGSVQVIDERVWRVDVEACFDGTCQTDAYVELAYEEVCGQDRLAAVERVDPADPSHRVLVAEFGYSDCGGSTELVTFSPEHPPFLLRSSSSTRGPETTSDVNMDLVDLTGDGLPDAADGVKLAHTHDVSGDPSDPASRSWGDRVDFAAGANFWLGARESSTTVHCSPWATLTFTHRAMIDVNGDGRLDVVQSSYLAPESAEPAPWEDGWNLDDPGWCEDTDRWAGWTVSGNDDVDDDPDVQGRPLWLILYAQEDGSFTPVDLSSPEVGREPTTAGPIVVGGPGFLIVPDPPVPYPRVASQPVLQPDGNPGQFGDPGYYVFEGPSTDLRDMDGDGWADIVRIDYESGDPRMFVYLNRGGGLGWADPVDWTRPEWSNGDEVWGLGRSVGTVDVDEMLYELEELDPTLEDVNAILLRSDVVSSLMDVNGDGLPDYVRVPHDFEALTRSPLTQPYSGWGFELNATGDAWQVWLGTGEGFSSARDWPAPSGVGLGATIEGKPARKLISVADFNPYVSVALTRPALDSGFQSMASLDAGSGDLGGFSTSMDDCGSAIPYVAPPPGGSPPGGVDPGVQQAVQNFVACASAAAESYGPSLDQLVADLQQDLVEVEASAAPNSVSPDFRVNMVGSTAAIDPDGMLSYAIKEGEPQHEVVGLLDMDGDHRPDLVDAEMGLWYRHLGAGFSDVPRAVPTWMGNSLGEAVSSQSGQVRIADFYVDGLGYFRSEVEMSESTREQTLDLRDVDMDGLPDLVRVPTFIEALAPAGFGEAFNDLPPGVYYNPNEPTGRLTEVVLGAGAVTTLDYVPSTWMEPAGDPDELHRMAARRDLLVRATVTDPVTGQSGFREFDYAYGVCGGGVCQGFEETRVSEYRRDPERSAQSVFLSETYTETLLDRDFAVPHTVSITAQYGDPWAGASVIGPVYELDYDYEIADRDIGLLGHAGLPALGAPVTAAILSSRTLRELQGGIRESTVDVERNAFGYVEVATHSDPARPQDTIQVQTSWTTDDAMTVAVPQEVSTWATDWNFGLAGLTDLQLVERGVFLYDDQTSPGGPGLTFGQLNRQEVSAGRTDLDAIDSEVLVWDFERTPRGALSATFGPAGLEGYVDSHANCEALPETARNALGHISTTLYDPLGRIVEAIDPNGVTNRTEYDAFGRVVSSHVRGVGGPELQISRVSYDLAAVPWSTSTETFEYDKAGALAGSGTAYDILDGFGAVAQSWAPDASGASWFVSDTIRDVAGNVLRTTYPRADVWVKPEFNPTTTWAGWTVYDPFGRPLESWEDYSAQLGRVSSSYPEPGVVLSEDAAGHRVQQTTDTHGRVVQVEEGLATLEVVGTYKFDGRGRIAEFADAVSNRHYYAYDGAGRLRQVWRKDGGSASALVTGTPNGCPSNNPFSAAPGVGPGACGTGAGAPGSVVQARDEYFEYEYDGPYPTALFEGSVAGNPYAAVVWEHDVLGRPVRQEVLDRTTGFRDHVYTWAWDGAWLGAVDEVADPAGVVLYGYQPEAFGAFGWPSTATRLWTDTGVVADFSYRYDPQGRVVATEWPEGAQVLSAYSPTGWLLQDQVLGAIFSGVPQTWISVDYAYHAQFGLPIGFTGTNLADPTMPTVAQADTWQNPTRLSSRAMKVGAQLARQVDWTRGANGLLLRKDITGLEPITYGYDHLKRLTLVAHEGGSLEEWTYDAIGNPTSAYSFAGVDWTTYDAAFFSEISGRAGYDASGNQIAEDYGYDALGRMTEWRTTHQGSQSERSLQYDGLGRLELCGDIATDDYRAYRYTADNTLALEDRGLLMGATPQFTERIHRFGGDRYEVLSGERIQQVLPFLRLVDGEPKWALIDADGHALAIYNEGGGEELFEVAGAYGARFDVGGGNNPPYWSGVDWKIDGIHGGEADHQVGYVHRGQRHALLDDGRWMQPEPLLALGPRGQARAMTGVYAGANPGLHSDVSGFLTGDEAILPTDDAETRQAIREATAGIAEDVEETVEEEAAPTAAGAGLATVDMSLDTLVAPATADPGAVVVVGIARVGVNSAFTGVAAENPASVRVGYWGMQLAGGALSGSILFGGLQLGLPGIPQLTKGAPIHHIATNKNFLSSVRGGPWSPRFKALFDKAGMSLDDAANRVAVPGHKGPHPEAYHKAVYQRLTQATKGVSGDDYGAALRAELRAIRDELATVGTELNRMLTKQ